MNKKIKQYSVLAVAAAAVLPMSCSKDKNDNSADDPNITVRSLNLTLTDNNTVKRVSSPTEVSNILDIDNNGVPDFYAILDYYNVDDHLLLYSAIIADEDSSGNKVSTYFVNGDIPMTRALTTSQQMQSSTPAYYVGYTSLYEKEDGDVLYNFQSEFKGKGDKFIGIKFKIGTDFHYGWIKVNLSSDAKTLLIKDVAYDTRPNTAITIGAR